MEIELLMEVKLEVGLLMEVQLEVLWLWIEVQIEVVLTQM